MWKGLILALLLLPSASTAEAQTIKLQTGQDLLRLCRAFNGATEPDPLELGICMGYVQGVVGGAYTLARNNVFCMPHTATIQDGVMAVVRYLNANPQELRYTAPSLVLAAMKVAYPCAGR